MTRLNPDTPLTAHEAAALDELDTWRTRAEAAEQELAVRDDAIHALEADLHQAHRTTATYRPLLEAAREWRHQFAPSGHRSINYPRRNALIDAIDNTLTAEDPPEPEQVAGRPGCSCRASSHGPGPALRPPPADLEAIDTALDEIRRNVDQAADSYALTALQAAVHLRVEVDRVEALRAELATELEDVQAEYAKTCSNFDEFAEGTLETQQQLRGEMAQLRVELETARGQLAMAQEMGDTARADLAEAQARVAWQGTLVAQLRLLVTAVEQWQQGGLVRIQEERTVQQQAAQARELLASLKPDQPAPVRTYDEIRAQVLYAGLPNVPVEPAVADESEADRG